MPFSVSLPCLRPCPSSLLCLPCSLHCLIRSASVLLSALQPPSFPLPGLSVKNQILYVSSEMISEIPAVVKGLAQFSQLYCLCLPISPDIQLHWTWNSRQLLKGVLLFFFLPDFFYRWENLTQILVSNTKPGFGLPTQHGEPLFPLPLLELGPSKPIASVLLTIW